MATEIITKRCPKCKQFKQLSEFYKDQSRKDKVRNDCKICQRVYWQSDKGKTVRKRYQQTKKGKKCSTRYRQSKKGKANYKQYYVHYTERCNARSAVSRAIKVGKLSRPNTLLCHYCPIKAKEYHHWHGYEKEHWLDIVPACMKCHHIYN